MLQARLGTAKLPSLGRNCLNACPGWLAGQVPRPWPQAAAIDLPMTFNR